MEYALFHKGYAKFEQWYAEKLGVCKLYHSSISLSS